MSTVAPSFSEFFRISLGIFDAIADGELRKTEDGPCLPIERVTAIATGVWPTLSDVVADERAMECVRMAMQSVQRASEASGDTLNVAAGKLAEIVRAKGLAGDTQ